MFSLLKEGNIINNKNYENHKKGPAINLKSLNRNLFGVDTCPLNNPIWHYDHFKMFIDINDEKFIFTDKIAKYFELIGDLKNNEGKYILTNYYKLTDKDINFLPFNVKFKNFLDNFASYLKTKKEKSNTKQFLKILRRYFNESYNEYNLVYYCNILNNRTISFKVTQECNVKLVFGDGEILTDNYINVNNIEKSFDNVYNHFIKKLQKISPKDFITSNLINVTGSSSFSKQLYSAYESKDNFDINFDLFVSNTIDWKSEQMKLKYIEEFKENNKSLFDKKLENVNFTGFNYIFLNIETGMLKSYEEKKRINDFYTNITKELISSWEELYNDII
jgi:hypothetical protein